MSISGDYPQPVQVNGFTCKNCTDVDYAKKHIDPAHPKAGPYGVNAKDDPTLKAQAEFRFGSAVTFGGQLARSQTDNSSTGGGNPNTPSTYQATRPGQVLNIHA